MPVVYSAIKLTDCFIVRSGVSPRVKNYATNGVIHTLTYLFMIYQRIHLFTHFAYSCTYKTSIHKNKYTWPFN
jgi:hypothetical protein